VRCFAKIFRRSLTVVRFRLLKKPMQTLPIFEDALKEFVAHVASEEMSKVNHAQVCAPAWGGPFSSCFRLKLSLVLLSDGVAHRAEGRGQVRLAPRIAA
jgi:hypothetical protein